MESLTAQFDRAVLDAFDVYNEKLDEMASERTENRRQLALLNTLISDHRDKPELIKHVFKRLEQDAYKSGEDATEFFRRCADEIFIVNLRAHKHEVGEDPEKVMKKLHPLWGKSWWTR